MRGPRRSERPRPAHIGVLLALVGTCRQGTAEQSAGQEERLVVGGDVLSDSPAGAGARLCERNSSKTTGHAERASYCQVSLYAPPSPCLPPWGHVQGRTPV